MRPFGEALSYRPELGTMIVLLPRDGGRPIRLEYESLFMFHVANAYEDGHETVVDIVAHDPSGGWATWNNYLCNFREQRSGAGRAPIRRGVDGAVGHPARGPPDADRHRDRSGAGVHRGFADRRVSRAQSGSRGRVHGRCGVCRIAVAGTVSDPRRHRPPHHRRDLPARPSPFVEPTAQTRAVPR
ncbi:carotenoid oxygenase family protein [Gordonia paraffinivorans]|uniref:carotenoid oxygenase family protein n=1 Tax=Gordonia paraffinivorans TaxID=175628 RepID=UPI001FF78511|nr:carotenoid oxygenase family protein [Gordonia paraffinivorans]